MPHTSRLYTSQVGYSGATPVVYDDMQTNIGRVIRPGGDDPTWRTYNLGIGGGVAYSVLGFALNDYVDFWVQTSHKMKLSTTLNFHLHYILPSDSAADRFKFQLDVAAGVGNGSFAAVAGSPFTSEVILDGTESTKNNIVGIVDIPAVNTTVSTVYAMQLTRIAASASEFAPEVYLLYTDCHYQIDTVGSLQEATKV